MKVVQGAVACAYGEAGADRLGYVVFGLPNGVGKV